MVTTSGFTTQALAFARDLPIELLDGQQLQELLSGRGMSTVKRETHPKLFE
ncbi:MAG TPA: restriction endonuclease [Terriglobia bacterium]|nr:restriction endonuclease [Terriglobia bacterium]